MTKKEKIRIFEEAIRLIQDGLHMGMCLAIYYASPAWVGFAEHEDLIHELLDSVGIHKPKRVQPDGYWYPLSKVGNAKRISLLKGAIKRLKAK